MKILFQRLRDTYLQWFVTKLGLVVLALAFIFSIGALSVSETSHRRLHKTFEAILRTRDVLEKIENILILLLDTEAGQHAYVITGRKEYLKPYEIAFAKLAPTMDELRTMTAGNPAQQKNVNILEALINEKSTSMAEIITIRDLAGIDAARAKVESDAGKHNMDALRLIVQDLEKEEQRLLAHFIEQRHQDVAAIRWGVFFIVLLNTGLILISVSLIWRELKKRQKEQQWFLENHTLLETMVMERTAQLTELSAHLENVREEEKSRLSREIHDALASTLVAAKIDISTVRTKLKNIDSQLTDRLTRALNALNEVIVIKRRIIEDLRPSLLDSLGLAAALRWQCDEFAKLTNHQCTMTFYDDNLKLPDPYSIAVYRIVQEALTNVIKYAKATQVTVEVKRDRDNFILQISDNGIGIGKDKTDHPTSHGLTGIRERARHMGGTFDISGIPGGGTTLVVKIPFAAITLMEAKLAQQVQKSPTL